MHLIPLAESASTEACPPANALHLSRAMHLIPLAESASLEAASTNYCSISAYPRSPKLIPISRPGIKPSGRTPPANALHLSGAMHLIPHAESASAEACIYQLLFDQCLSKIAQANSYQPPRYQVLCVESSRPATCYLPPATCYLPPATCHMPPATCYLLPATCYLLPATCSLPPATCYLLLASCYNSPIANS
jgi:hypothetical protein